MATVENYFDTKAIVAKATATPVFANDFKVAKIGFRLRALGTATYVAFGTSVQEFRLTTVNDYFEIPANICAYINARKIMVIADQADQATVEVWWVEASE